MAVYPNRRKSTVFPQKPSYSSYAQMNEADRHNHRRAFQQGQITTGGTSTGVVSGISDSGSSGETGQGVGAATGGQFALRVNDRFYGDGVTTTFATSAFPLGATLTVSLGGVDQDPTGSNGASAWTYSYPNLTFSAAPPSGINGLMTYDTASSVL